MHISVLDLGSNSFHLLQARVHADRSVECLGDHKHLLRFGEKAFQTGEIDGADWQAGMQALGDLLATARESSPVVVAVATSVFRDTRNGRDFLAEVQRRLGLTVQLLSEGNEAELSLRGALASLGGHAGATGELAVMVDMGGGSLELAVGDRTHCLVQRSLPLGVLRLSNACLPPDRVLRDDGVTRLESLVCSTLAASAEAVRRWQPSRVVLASGTARAVARLAAAELVSPGVWQLTRRAIATLVAELMHELPAALSERGVPAARADTIAAGAVALGAVLDLLGAEAALVTSTGLREGVAARAADRLAAEPELQREHQGWCGDTRYTLRTPQGRSGASCGASDSSCTVEV